MISLSSLSGGGAFAHLLLRVWYCFSFPALGDAFSLTCWGMHPKEERRISTTTQWVDERTSTTQLRWSKRQHHTQSEQTCLPRGGIRCAHALLLYNWSRSVGHRVVPSMLVLADPTLRAVDKAAIPLSDAGDRFFCFCCSGWGRYARGIPSEPALKRLRLGDSLLE